jgi:hypothetical protein
LTFASALETEFGASINTFLDKLRAANARRVTAEIVGTS